MLNSAKLVMGAWAVACTFTPSLNRLSQTEPFFRAFIFCDFIVFIDIEQSGYNYKVVTKCIILQKLEYFFRIYHC